MNCVHFNFVHFINLFGVEKSVPFGAIVIYTQHFINSLFRMYGIFEYNINLVYIMSC